MPLAETENKSVLGGDKGPRCQPNDQQAISEQEARKLLTTAVTVAKSNCFTFRSKGRMEGGRPERRGSAGTPSYIVIGKKFSIHQPNN